MASDNKEFPVVPGCLIRLRNANNLMFDHAFIVDEVIFTHFYAGTFYYRVILNGNLWKAGTYKNTFNVKYNPINNVIQMVRHEIFVEVLS